MKRKEFPLWLHLIIQTGLSLGLESVFASDPIDLSGRKQQCQQSLSDPQVAQFGQVYMRILGEWLNREEPQVGQTVLQYLRNSKKEISLFRFPIDLSLSSIHTISLKSSLAILAKQAAHQLSPIQRLELESYVVSAIQDLERAWAQRIDEVQTTRKRSALVELKFNFSLPSDRLNFHWLLSDDGQKLAVYYKGPQGGLARGQWFRLFATHSPKVPLFEWNDVNFVSRAVFSTNSQVVALNNGYSVRCWNANGAVITITLPNLNLVREAVPALSPDGRWMAAPTYHGRVIFFDLQGTGQLGIAHTEIDVAGGVGVDRVEWLGDGSKLITIDASGGVVVWDWATLTPAIPQIKSLGYVGGWKVSHDQKYLALYHPNVDQGVVQLWDLTTQKQIWAVPSKSPGMEFSPDGTTLAIVGTGGDLQLHLLSIPTLSEKLVETGAESMPDIAFDPSGRWLLVTGDGNYTLKWWDLKEQNWAGSWLDRSIHIRSKITITPNRKKLAILLADSVVIYDYAELLKDLGLE